MRLQILLNNHPVFLSLTERFPLKGTFVEFGAADGVTGNLTPYLVKRGWSGYYTEPIPEAYKECRNNYIDKDRVIVDHVAIGDSDGWLEMHVTGRTSTGNDAFYEHTKTTMYKSMITGQKIKVRMMTLNNFLEKHNVPKGFELLVVDVEGMEWEVFKGFDI